MIRSLSLVDYLQGIIKFTLENFTTHSFHLGKSLCFLEQLVYGVLKVVSPHCLEKCRAGLMATLESPGKYMKSKNDDS